MLNKALVAGFLFVFAGLFAGGCAKTTCEKFCDYYEKCGIFTCTSAAVDECVDDYKDEDFACRKALRQLANCVDDRSCTSISSGACDTEQAEVNSECSTY